MENHTFFVVGIGASAGGQDALKVFFENLPNDLPAAFVVVTHLFRGHKSQLDKIISGHTRMPVQRIRQMMPI